MNDQSEDIKSVLLRTNEEYQQLVTEHHNLENRLHALGERPYLSEPEQLEEVTLKKLKLQVRDRMEAIVRHRPD